MNLDEQRRATIVCSHALKHITLEPDEDGGVFLTCAGKTRCRVANIDEALDYAIPEILRHLINVYLGREEEEEMEH